MKFLPIVERELRVAARRRATHGARFGVALVALGVLFWVLWLRGSASASPQETGKVLFAVLSVISFFLCLAFGTYATSDCLSVEKRGGTLGLLFLTDLRGYDVVLGKLAATSVSAVFALLAIVPVLALPLLMGGVPQALVWAVALCLLNTLFFSLAAGMFVSSISVDERRTVSGTLILIALIAGGLPLIGVLLMAWFGGEWGGSVAGVLNLFSPASGFFEGLDSFNAVSGARSRGTERYWASMALTHAQAWVFLGLACAILPRTWHDTGGEQTAPGSWRDTWRRFCYGGAVARRDLRERLLAINPVAWLSCRDRFGSSRAWRGIAFVALCWLVGLLTVGDGWLEAPAAIVFALILHGTLKYQLAGEACRRFAEDRRSGALELLLSTPMTVEEILRGQTAALRWRFAGPFVAVLLADTLLVAGAWNSMRSDASEFLLTCAMGMGVLVPDALALSWLGMWNGLTARNFTLAWIKTLFWVLWLPWLVFVLTTITIAFLGRGFSSTAGFPMVLGWWTFLAVATDVIAMGYAHARLRPQFRDLAVGGPARSKRG